MLNFNIVWGFFSYSDANETNHPFQAHELHKSKVQ